MTTDVIKLRAALEELLARYIQAIGNEGIECHKARIALAATASVTEAVEPVVQGVEAVAYRAISKDGKPATDWIDGKPTEGEDASWCDGKLEIAYAAPPAPPSGSELPPLPKVWGVSRDAESPGQKSVLVAFDRILTNDELRHFHEFLAGRAAHSMPAKSVSDKREAFEAWMRSEHSSHSLATMSGRVDDTSIEYQSAGTQHKWLGFQAGRALLAGSHATVPEGCVIVPKEPTPGMCQAGQWKAREWPKFPLRISPIYQAMIAAAPLPKERT